MGDRNAAPALVSIVLPTYNERTNSVLLIEELHRELQGYAHEIVLVDDDSPDGTYDAVCGLAYPWVSAFKRTGDPSLAKSIRHGVENSKGDAVVIMDSDFNHQPKYLPQMIDMLSYYDCVSASRFLYGGRMNSRFRHVLSWLFNIFVRLTTGGQVTDSLYGFVAIRRAALGRVNFDNIFWGYGDYCIRLIAYLQREGVSILQIPAVNGERKAGVGNSRFLKVFWQYFTETLALTYRMRFLDRSRR